MNDTEIRPIEQVVVDRLREVVQEHKLGAIGGGVGAAIGAAVGGPLGAAVGGCIGGLLGGLIEENSGHGD